jgi:hypothetical protein
MHGLKADTMEWKTSSRGLTAIDAAVALIATLLVVQIWLLTATMEALLAGHHEAALPGLLSSAVLALGCLGLYVFVVRIDRGVRRDRRPPPR